MKLIMFKLILNLKIDEYFLEDDTEISKLVIIMLIYWSIIIIAT